MQWYCSLKAILLQREKTQTLLRKIKGIDNTVMLVGKNTFF